MIDTSWRFGSSGSWFSRGCNFLRNRVNIRLMRFLLINLGANPRKRLLEAGSGSAFGTYVGAKQQGVSQSVALDHDVDALREAKNRDSSIVAVVGDIARMPFKSEVFDLVWNSSTFEHLEDGHSSMVEMKRVAAADGFIFCGVPYRYGPLFFQPLIGNTKFGKWIGKVFSKNTLSLMFQSEGLEPLKSHFYFFGFFVGILAKKHE